MSTMRELSRARKFPRYQRDLRAKHRSGSGERRLVTDERLSIDQRRGRHRRRRGRCRRRGRRRRCVRIDVHGVGRSVDDRSDLRTGARLLRRRHGDKQRLHDDRRRGRRRGDAEQRRRELVGDALLAIALRDVDSLCAESESSNQTTKNSFEHNTNIVRCRCRRVDRHDRRDRRLGAVRSPASGIAAPPLAPARNQTGESAVWLSF